MKLFNGVITIVSTPEEVAGATSSWSFEAKFQSSDGFLAAEAKKGDMVFLKGYNNDTDESQFCSYIVESVSPVGSGRLQLTVKYNEPDNEAVFAPSDNDENVLGLISRKTSSVGHAFLPTAADGVEESTLEKARNVDLKTRDDLLNAHIAEMVKNVDTGSGSGGSATDDSKLPIAGGTITGDLTVNNKTTLNELAVEAKDVKVAIDEQGVDVAISSNTAVDKKSVSSPNTINATVSRVSEDSANFTDSLSGASAQRQEITRATNAVTSTEEVTSNDSSAKKITNVTGAITNIQLNSMGSTSASVEVSASGDAGHIDLNANKVNVAGALSVTGNETVSGNVTAPKFFSTTDDTEIAENQVITKSNMTNYVTNFVEGKLANYSTGGVTQADVETLLGLYLKQSDFELRLQNAMAQIEPSNILQNSTHHFVTDEQIATWNAKQEPINVSAFQKISDKGQPAGYAPLDGRGKIDSKYLDLSAFTTASKAINLYTESGFQAALAQNVKGVLVITVPDKLLAGDTSSLTKVDGWELWRIGIAEQSDIDAGRATTIGQQIAVPMGTYKTSAKIADWSGISNIPSSLVYKNSTTNKINEGDLPTVFTGNQKFGGVEVDKFGRVIGGSGQNVSGSLGWYTLGEDAEGNIQARYHGTPGITISITSTGATINVPQGGYFDYILFYVDEKTFTKTQYKICYDKNNAFTVGDGTLFKLSPMPLVRLFDDATTEFRNFTSVFNQDDDGGNYVVVSGADIKANQPHYFSLQF